jgi:Ca2+-binding EF-hand superfamily protein
VVWSQKYDADGDGTISADELYQVMLGCGVQLTEVQLAEIIKEQDSDGVC